MQRLSLLLVLCAFGLAAAPAARAYDLTLAGKPLRLDLTESLLARARPWDPGNSDAVKAYYHSAANRLNVQATWNHFTAGLRLDSNAYFSVPVPGSRLINQQCPKVDPPPQCFVTEPGLADRYQTAPPGTTPNAAADVLSHFIDFNRVPVGISGDLPIPKVFEKMFLTYSHELFDVTLGDSYVNLGRGLVLSLRKVDQLSADTTLFGGKASLRVGDFSAMLLGGRVNIQNIDDVEARYLQDPADFIAGGRADYRIAGKVSVGVEGAWGDQPNLGLVTQRNRHARLGLVVDAPRPLPWLSFYGEYVRAWQSIDTATENGWALYLSATAFAGITSWLLEFKDYENYQPWKPSSTIANSVAYDAAPTLERVLVQITDNSNVRAGRLKTDVRLSPDLTFYVSPELGVLRTAQKKDNLLADAYAGAEVRWNEGLSHMFPIVEARREWGSESGDLVEQLIAVELDAAQSLTKGWSIVFQGMLWLRERPLESVPWQEGTAYLGVKWTPKLFVALGSEFTTQQKYLQDQHVFVNGQVQWQFTPGTAVTLFAGGRRPGLRCISGVCRNFAAFQGLELSFVARG